MSLAAELLEVRRCRQKSSPVFLVVLLWPLLFGILVSTATRVVWVQHLVKSSAEDLEIGVALTESPTA